MLFDLKSAGRRRTVKVVYAGLIGLFLFTFIFIGVGTGLNGGLNFFESINKNSGGGSYGGQVEKAEKRTKREPQSAAAWAALIQAQLRESSGSEFSNQNQVGFTKQGKKLIAKIQRSWERYLTLEPKNPSVELAKRMLTVLGEEGLDQPAAAVAALEIVVAAEPNNKASYAQLAEYAYQAGNKRQGDLAAERALALAPKDERARLKGELAALKKNGGHASSSAGSSAGEEGEG
ncbi:MAG: hypothetical protein KGJ43_04920 [Acidobacteriota bacterium]|nr:hypothetical protein [Acidobacteriota bacterium]